MSYARSWQPPTAAFAEEALLRDVLGRRVLAFLVDALLLTVICAAVWVLLFGFGLLTLGLGFPLLGLLPAVPLLYNWIALLTPGAATPGQALLGLTVRADDDLGRPSPLEALLWAVGFYVTVALGMIWLLAALLTARHRTLHDMLSGLVVVRTRALTNGALASGTLTNDAAV